ncbi:kinesin-like protein [Plakobranchus ocellatus]|uniref:Kinesin-like protein n=1 Tax=Plakobranchus ocellatus TaxID=259542 RepID=A0AAV3Y8Q4_9GAST|nr:kinesin-like protein [Plakobranchus ocellatus]
MQVWHRCDAGLVQVWTELPRYRSRSFRATDSRTNGKTQLANHNIDTETPGAEGDQEEPQDTNELYESRIERLQFLLRAERESCREREDTISSLRRLLDEHERRVRHMDGITGGEWGRERGCREREDTISSLRRLLDEHERRVRHMDGITGGEWGRERGCRECEDTISSLRRLLDEHERRVRHMDGITGGSGRGTGTTDFVRISPTQKLLDQVQRLQGQKSELLLKVPEYEASLVEPTGASRIQECAASGQPVTGSQVTTTHSVKNGNVCQVGLCSTDTEKELDKANRARVNLDSEVKKLIEENAMLKERLSSVETSFNSSTSALPSDTSTAITPVGSSALNSPRDLLTSRLMRRLGSRHVGSENKSSSNQHLVEFVHRSKADNDHAGSVWVSGSNNDHVESVLSSDSGNGLAELVLNSRSDHDLAESVNSRLDHDHAENVFNSRTGHDRVEAALSQDLDHHQKTDQVINLGHISSSSSPSAMPNAVKWGLAKSCLVKGTQTEPVEECIQPIACEGCLQLAGIKDEMTSLRAQLGAKSEEIEIIKQSFVEEKERESRAATKAMEKLKSEKDAELFRLRSALTATAEVARNVCRDFQQLRAEHSALRECQGTILQEHNEQQREIQNKVREILAQLSASHKLMIGRYLREMRLRRTYHNQLVELKGNIRVLCRVRPWIKEDGSLDEHDVVVTLDPDDIGLVNVNSRDRLYQFDLDKAFGMQSTQSEVFEEVSSLVRSTLDGYNVCIFAYGQTGSGKTYTMEGPAFDPGIHQRALELLFQESSDPHWDYTISVSVLEIYNENIIDLLNSDQSQKLEVKLRPEGGLHVPGLVEIPATSVEQVNQIFETGRENRATQSTVMNERSSRSHCLLCVTVSGLNLTTGTRTTGRLNLVDLAGSERLSKTQADGDRLREAKNINRSLACLGDVMHALRARQQHVPYRNSKLTYLLQDSLGGDSKTLMIVQVAPGDQNVAETLCTLAFGQRVKIVELGAATRHTETPPTSPACPAWRRSVNLNRSFSSTGSSSPCPSPSPSPSPSPTPGKPLRRTVSTSSAPPSLTPTSGRRKLPSPASAPRSAPAAARASSFAGPTAQFRTDKSPKTPKTSLSSSLSWHGVQKSTPRPRASSTTVSISPSSSPNSTPTTSPNETPTSTPRSSPPPTRRFIALQPPPTARRPDATAKTSPRSPTSPAPSRRTTAPPWAGRDRWR